MKNTPKILKTVLLACLVSFLFAFASPAGTITWTNAIGGNWNDPANWDPNQVPGSEDQVSIPGGALPIYINSTAAAGGLNLGGGASLTVESGGVLNLAGEGDKYLYGALTNFGTVTWQGGTLYVEDNPNNNVYGSIWNQAGGVFDIQCDRALTWQAYGVAAFHNAGTLRKSAGAGATDFIAYLDNTGTVLAQAGTLRFHSGAPLSGGSYEAAAGAAVHFVAGAFAASGLVDWRGAGEVRVVGGAITLDELAGTLEMHGGTLTGQQTVKGTLNWHAGGLADGASLAVAAGGVVNLLGDTAMVISGNLTVATGGVLNLAGEGDKYLYAALTNWGTVNWQGGRLLVEDNANYYMYGAIWNQAGGVFDIQCDRALTWQSYGVAAFHNAGTLRKSAGAGATDFIAYLDNTGTVLAQAGTLRFHSGAPLSGGSYEAAAGAAVHFVAGAFAASGLVDWRGAGEVRVVGGAITLDELAGTLEMHGGTLTGQQTVKGTLNWHAGGLADGASLAVAAGGVVNLLGDTAMVISGNLTVATGGVLNLAGEGDKYLYAALTNWGTVNWQGGRLLVEDNANYYMYGAIWNQAGGVFDIQCDRALAWQSYGVAAFHNAGTLRKSAGGGATDFIAYLDNTGTVLAQAGFLQFKAGAPLSGGSYEAAAGAAVHFVAGAFAASGLVDWRGAGEVRVVGGAITLDELAGTLEMHGGTLTGQQTVKGTLNWYAGDLAGGASLAVAAGGVVNLLGDTAKAISGNLTVAAGGVLNLAGEGDKYLYAALTNLGTVNWQGGRLLVEDNANYSLYGAIWNQAGGVFDIQCDQALTWQAYGVAAFHNAGTLRKSAGGGATDFIAYLDNTGTVLAQAGFLQFKAGAPLSGGSYEAAAGAAVHFVAGAFAASGLVDWRGAGEVRVVGGAITLDELAGTLEMHGGTLTGQQTVKGTLNWYAGDLAGGASLAVAAGGVVNLLGDTTKAISGNLTLAAGGVLNLAGEGDKYLYAALTNLGTVNWQGGRLLVEDNANYSLYGAIWNQAGGVFDIQCDQALTWQAYGVAHVPQRGNPAQERGRGNHGL